MSMSGSVAREAEQVPAVVGPLVHGVAREQRGRPFLGADEVQRDQSQQAGEDQPGQHLAEGEGRGRSRVTVTGARWVRSDILPPWATATRGSGALRGLGLTRTGGSHSGATVPDSHRTSRSSSNGVTLYRPLPGGQHPVSARARGYESRDGRTGGWWGKVDTHPSAVLLVVQLVGVLLYPFMENPFGRVGFEAFGALVLGLAIWSVRDSPGPTWIAIVLGVAASALSIADAVSHSPALELASAILHAAVLLLGRRQPDGLHAGRPRGDHRRALCGRGHLHPGRLGVRVRLQRCADRPAGLVHRRGRTRSSSGPGWSCCSSASPTCPAPACPTSCRSPRRPGRR